MSNVKVTIIDRDGISHEIDAPTDMSMNMMETVKAYELAEEGTFGICGGMCMCASCQCYIESEGVGLNEMEDEEEAMLSEAFHVQENSRLSCQIPVTKELEGLIIRIAPKS
ncbi:MAG: 2Fe-2S iron-sulfur cluster-binding protein [Weeksellaceae bacterium]|nr:2Fe-2S iron-sulfur cluster-binding protein [Weeksellaceae bacterium]